MKSPFAERLAAGPCLLLDGGLGTMFLARGLPAGAPPEAWVRERPEEVLAVHRAYAEAGSDAVHTTTFGAHPIRLARFGLREACEEINAQAVRLARAAGAPFVIGDVGPTGEFLPPVGSADAALMTEGYLVQGRILREAGVDAIHVETMTDLREAAIALEALLEAAPDLPVMVSMTFDRRKRGFFTIMGNPLLVSLRELASLGAAAVGANCTLTSGAMVPLTHEAVSAIACPLVIQPNAGQPVMTDAGLGYTQDPEEFAADLAPPARTAGVGAVGGCCGTDPRFISALRRRLDART